MSYRPTGYYPVIFNWPSFGRPETHWEPASWDDRTKSWVMIGNRTAVPEDQEHRIFLAIGDQCIVMPAMPREIG